ncbi:MAG TPA: amidohydrolase family protein [Bryobacteraceae bacterium]|nr:amidohydrolase family protein [Bryobacteraceae bacterium]
MEISRRLLLSTAGPALLAQDRPAAKPLIIDAHCHAGHGQEMSAPWTTRADPEITLRHMEEAGIDRTVIFPINNDDFEKPNQEIADLCGRYPGKFIGFAKHDPQTEAGRIQKMLRHEVEELGLKGLKLHKLPTREVLDAVAELRIPILYHPEKVANFHMIASEYPGINFIMAHLGSFASERWSEHLEAIAVARRYANVYLETSSVVFYKFLEMAARELGAGKIIFGSDGPEVDSRVELYKIRLLKLSPVEEAQVLGGNIARLLPRGTVQTS